MLGIVENMSTYVCGKCGHEEHIFGSGGGAGVAEKYQTEVLAQLPLDLELRLSSDRGDPIVHATPESFLRCLWLRGILRNLGNSNES